MGREEFFRELHGFIGVLRAGSVVPADVIEHYMSWGSVQHGEAGDSLEGTILLVTERWFCIYDVKRIGAMEEAIQRAVPLSALKQVTRTWRGSRGFDESDGTDAAEEYSVVLQFEGEEDIKLPLRESDYNQSYKAWRRAQALSDALLKGTN